MCQIINSDATMKHFRFFFRFDDNRYGTPQTFNLSYNLFIMQEENQLLLVEVASEEQLLVQMQLKSMEKSLSLLHTPLPVWLSLYQPTPQEHTVLILVLELMDMQQLQQMLCQYFKNFVFNIKLVYHKINIRINYKERTGCKKFEFKDQH